MSSLICPGHISNSTLDKCIGNIKINDPELMFISMLILLSIVGCFWAFLYLRKKFRKEVQDA